MNHMNLRKMYYAWFPGKPILSPDQKPSVKIEGWLIESIKNSSSEQNALLSGKLIKSSLIEEFALSRIVKNTSNRWSDRYIY